MKWNVLTTILLFFTLLFTLMFETPGVAGAGSNPLTLNIWEHQIDQPVESQTDWFTQAEHDACPGGFYWWPCDGTYWPRTDGQPTGATWVVNHTGCYWDPDDSIQYGGNGYLTAQTSVVKTICAVAEADSSYKTNYDITAWWSNTPKETTADFYANSPSLVISACYSPPGRCFPLSARWDSSQRLYRYQGCIKLAYHNDDPALGPIPDSGKGGIGLVTSVTLRVSNPTSRKVGKVSGTFVQGSYLAPGTCQAPGPFVADYPFQVAT